MSSEKKRVVVCGGGVIGVCTAYFLSRRGDAAVTLVEKSSIAAAASGKAGGFLALDWCDGGPLSSLARTSFDLHRSLAEELNGRDSYGYRRLDTLSLTVTETTTSESSRRPGRDVPSWVDGPAKGVRTIGTTETTGQVHPGMFCRTLSTKAVEDYALKVVMGNVQSVVVGDDGGTKGVVLEGNQEIEADSVVLALGPWSGRLDILASMFRVYGLKAHSIVLETMDKKVITPHALFLSYYPTHGGRPMDPEVYPRPTGEVYICGMSSEAEVPDDPEKIYPIPESIQMLKTVAGTVSSHLSEGEAMVKAEQACFLPCTDDSVPIIGEIPGVKGCYVATGHSCWGILNGPATGLAVSELVMEGVSKTVDLGWFSPSRFIRAKR